jgi:hypothetical protein
MKAMLDPRMVAASIHGLALSVHGTSPPPDRITASSQGALMETMDAIQGVFGPKIDAEEVVRRVDRHGKAVTGKARAIGP